MLCILSNGSLYPIMLVNNEKEDLTGKLSQNCISVIFTPSYNLLLISGCLTKDLVRAFLPILNHRLAISVKCRLSSHRHTIHVVGQCLGGPDLISAAATESQQCYFSSGHPDLNNPSPNSVMSPREPAADWRRKQ